MKRAKRIKLVRYCSRDTRGDNMGKRLKLAERWAIDSKKPMVVMCLKVHLNTLSVKKK